MYGCASHACMVPKETKEGTGFQKLKVKTVVSHHVGTGKGTHLPGPDALDCNPHVLSYYDTPSFK